MTLNSDWGNTTIDLPQGNWLNRLTGEHLKPGKMLIEDLLREFPVALITQETT